MAAGGGGAWLVTSTGWQTLAPGSETGQHIAARGG